MRYGQTLWVALTGKLSATLLLAVSTGCALMPQNGFLDPTKVGRFPLDGKSKETGIKRVLTPRETPAGIANATEPSPEDLVAQYDDYRIRPSDQVAIGIDGLITPDVPYNAAFQVSATGDLRISQIGTIHAAGLTEGELEREIASRLREGKILPNPIVTVFLQSQSSKRFNILGSVAAAGVYPIPDPNFRLLDALSLARDVGPGAKKLYVIRRGDAMTPMAGAEASPPPSAPKIRSAPDELVVPPPDEPVREVNFSTRGGRSAPVIQDDGDPKSPPANPSRTELDELMNPQDSRSTTRSSGQDRPFTPLTFDPQTGEWADKAPPEAPPKPVTEPVSNGEDQPFDWDDVPQYEQMQRVIAIDVMSLKNGDPRMNIIVRDRDTIQVPVDTGVFYMMGEINRPGVYSFNDREITIKQAIAIAGGFSALAWPSHCEVIRREPGTDKQITIPVNLDQIFATLEPDFLLRDDDTINIGSDFVAPFLYVIRNSFRFTYGFGFVYDRNYADKDAYGYRLNPEVAKQARRAARGLSF